MPRANTRITEFQSRLILLALLCASLTGCGEDGSLSLGIEFDDTVNADDVQYVELNLINSCDEVALGDAVNGSDLKGTWRFHKGEPLPNIGDVSSGKHALYGRGFASDCSVIAAGCVAFSAKEGKQKQNVTLTLTSSSCEGSENQCGTRVCGDGGLPGNPPPSAPGTLTATGVIGGAMLSWGKATDNVLVDAYRIYRSDTSGFTPSPDTQVGRVSTLQFMDVAPAGTHYYVVVAEDNEEALGPPSNEASADALADEEAPSAPGTLVATTGVGTITLTWGAATDNVAVAKYTVHRDTSANVVPSDENRVAEVTGLTHVDLAAPGTYYFRVVAEDASGNRGPASNEVSGISAQAPPSAPGTLTATDGIGKVTLAWGAATDDVGIASYHVHRGTVSGFTPNVGNLIATPTGLNYTDTVSPGTYFYVIIPVDVGGLSGPESNEAMGTSSADTTAPSAPTGLTATGGSHQIALSWTASTDNVGVVGYNVYRSQTQGFVPSGGTLLAQTTSTSYQNTNILGTYYYRVVARDAAGNVSAASSEANATASQSLTYDWATDYNAACPFNISGSAACGTEVRLTDASAYVRGGAYAKDVITLSADTSFSVTFRLQFDQPSATYMADGMVFVIRKTTAPPLGHVAGAMGYGASPMPDVLNINAPAVTPSVGVVFDTYPSGHIAVVKDGLPDTQYNSTPYTIPTGYVYAWIDYDGPTNNLRIYAAATNSKPANPLITYVIDIPTTVGGSSTYFGFTAGTGQYYARQRVGPVTIKTYD